MICVANTYCPSGETCKPCIPWAPFTNGKVDASIYLAALEGTTGVILEQVTGGSPFKFSVNLGTRIHLHSGAPGKALLAALPEGESEDRLDSVGLAVKASAEEISLKFGYQLASVSS